MLQAAHFREGRMDQLLYHYTDFISCDGILRGRELRVNNVLNMNDAKEMELFISGIFDAVVKRFAKSKNEKIISQLNATLSEIRSRYFDFSAYAACFSEFRDDAAQWERYANRGKGVCLAFRKSMLEKLTGGAISLQKVFYQDNMEAHPLVDRIFTLLKDSEELEVTEDLMQAAHEVLRNSASFKHPSFSSENEIRLIVMPFDVPDFDLKPNYHVARERIKKYYPLDLDSMCRKAGMTIEDLIVEIIVGPESTQSMPILHDYLQDMGLAVLAKSICGSRCPLRSRI